MYGTGSVSSSVELISNAVFITGGDVRNIRFIFQPGAYPQRAMPSLLHEAAHWETFCTPVGEALAQSLLHGWHAKKLHDFYRENKLKQDGFFPEHVAKLDFTRFTITSELLRPLAEGIALFVEFDHLPRDSPVTCMVTKLAAMMFPPLEELDEQTLLAKIALENLSAMRCSTMQISRKENLLCQPYSARSGGYLPGYVLVKALRNYLISERRLVKLLDGDLFIYLLKIVLFGDLELARLILDHEEDFFPASELEGTANQRDVMNKIIIRVEKLFDYLLHDMDDGFIDRVEDMLGSGDPWVWADLQIEECKSTIPKLERALNDPFQGNGLEEGWDQADLLMKNRRLLCLASFNVQIKVNDNRRCLIYRNASMEIEDVIMSVKAMDGAVEATGAGTLEVYFSDEFDSSAIISVAHLNGAIVACFASNNESNFDPAKFANQRPSFSEASSLASEIRGNLSVFAASDPLCAHYLNQMEDITEKLYCKLSGPLFSEYLKGNLERITKVDTLLDLIPNRHIGTFSAYCMLSLAHGGVLALDQHRATIEAVSGMPVHEYLAQLDALKNETGVPFASIRGNLLFCNF